MSSGRKKYTIKPPPAHLLIVTAEYFDPEWVPTHLVTCLSDIYVVHGQKLAGVGGCTLFSLLFACCRVVCETRGGWMVRGFISPPPPPGGVRVLASWEPAMIYTHPGAIPRPPTARRGRGPSRGARGGGSRGPPRWRGRSPSPAPPHPP